jgi:uncharacterized protein GlcG (DUF336 family)
MELIATHPLSQRTQFIAFNRPLANLLVNHSPFPFAETAMPMSIHLVASALRTIFSTPKKTPPFSVPPPIICEPLESRCLLSTAAGPTAAYTALLTQAAVKTILAQAASQATDGQIITVADRDGHILGLIRKGTTPGGSQEQIRIIKAIDEAVTASSFESTQDAFSTRTARFIIQDHFPQPLFNTPGGPLYGVQFSSQPTSDVNPVTAFAISGDPGGIPLFINGVPVGGIGVSGAPNQHPARNDAFLANDTDINAKPFNGNEEHSFNEAVALAGAQGFMAPTSIRADKIFVGGLRLPFTVDQPAHALAPQSYDQLLAAAAITPLSFTNPFSSAITADGALHDGFRAFPAVTFNTTPGELRDAIIDGSPIDPAGTKLTTADVTQIISNALKQALRTRAAIRQPIGVAARVYVTVVDTQGNRIGSFRMGDATNFSYDVAVQKARTSAFFSSDIAAFSSRAIGFLAQGVFPPGINHSRPGPLFHIQNDLAGLNPFTLTAAAPKFAGVLKNGITIFPGGFPIYKNGKLVGAIGVSGDGVDQDDIISYAGTAGYRPSFSILSSKLNQRTLTTALDAKLLLLQTINSIDPALIAASRASLSRGLNHVRLPYVKFPRNPTL